MKCAQCGFDNPAEMLFCLHCGSRLSGICPACGFSNPPEARYCGRCGASLTELVEPAVQIEPLKAELERIHRAMTQLEMLRGYIPPALAETLSTRGRIEGERRLVTVMFADISGFTAMSEQLDPEEVLAILNSCFQEWVEIIHHYEGMVDKFIGDCVMALFGAPVAHENDPERAIRAALEIMDALRTFNGSMKESLKTPSGETFELDLHVGISTGLVIVGNVGSTLRMSYTVIGDTVNLASRLEDASAHGQIFVSEQTYRLARHCFDFTAHPALAIKGKRKPVAVYEVLGVKAIPESARGLEGVQSPLVGRDGEYAMLQQCVDWLIEGNGGIATIIGEAGLGKSRLVTEVRQSVLGQEAGDAAPLRWLEGHCLSYGQPVSYWPFVKLIEEYAGISREDRVEEAQEILRQKVGGLAGAEMGEGWAHLAALLSLRTRGEQVEPLDTQQLLMTMRRFFTNLAHSEPTVVVFEDLHWADPASIEMLERIMSLVDQVPLLLVCTYRPDRERDCWRLRERARREYPHRHTELWLRQLSGAESTLLMSNLLQVKSLPRKVWRLVSDKAEGNPFYLEEVIRSLMAAGVLVQGDGGWQMAQEIDSITVPSTAQGVIMARIDRLDAESKGVLQVAAVVGRDFALRVLTQVARGREVEASLERLQQLEFIQEVRPGAERMYTFRHGLIQEVTYESLLRAKRRELHLRVGECLEEQHRERQDELTAQLAAQLAMHFDRGDRPQKAIGYYLTAMHRASQLYVSREVVQYGERIRELLVSPAVRPVGVLDQKQMVGFYHTLGKAYEYLAQYNQSGECYDLALAGLDEETASIRRARLLKDQGWLHYRKNEYDAAISLHRRALAILEEGDRGRDTAEIYRALGCAHADKAEYDQALHYLTESLTISTELGDEDGIAMTSASIGIICALRGDYDEALRYHQESVRIKETRGDVRGVAIANLNIGEVHKRRGDYGQAITFYRRSLEGFENFGDEYGVALAHNNLGEVYKDEGTDYADTAVQHLQQAVAIYKRLEDKEGLSDCQRIRAEVYLNAGDLAQAERDCQEALSLAEGVGPEYVGQAHHALGRIYRAQGDRAAARREFAEAMAIFTETENAARLAALRAEMGLGIDSGRAEPTR